ncbi:tetratricopeptide repeat protein [Candidatus Parabeggiatoa sp. HSG14]|uniref:tetratricopeptide repeat protein n=1 Tax=Candidatus Parabeggiatoa sp. HSG14 TaxID=3055593 RepID=UPI0025A7B8DB|nr:tetratricopeptide repeat protein [Thiotrichales bacterium HSG14]
MIKGLGVPKDYAMAKQLFQQSAEQGDATAQDNLGYMYQHGLGMPKDYVMAEQWFIESMKQGNEMGRKNLCRLYFIQKKFEATNEMDCSRE